MVNNAPIEIDIVSDVVCPWCAIGYHQLAKAATERGLSLSIRWHPFELNPNMPEAGENLRAHLAAKYGTTLEGSIHARARLTEMGAQLGFKFDYFDEMRMFNTFKAHQLIDWAGDQGLAHDTKLALFRAYFGERKDISNDGVLADTAASVGLDQADALAVLKSGERAQSVREKQRVWIEHGITGVPAMIFDQSKLVPGAAGAEAYGSILSELAQ